MPVPSLGWWCLRGSGGIHSLADLRGKRVGYRDGHGGPLGERPRGRSLQIARSAAGWVSRPERWTRRFWMPTSLPGICMNIPSSSLKLVPEYVPHERWNMALAVRAKDTQLLVEINRALAQLAETGELKKIYAEYAVPFRPPFTAIDRAQRHRPRPWQRIRERRELVVSMDPANLPYSAAKGEHPGLDVELARALAQQLDVKLRIDWLDIQHETAVGQLLERPVRPGVGRGCRG